MTLSRILVTGAKGMLGQDVVQAFSKDYQVTALGRKELDITEGDKVASVLSDLKPQEVINCAAFTKVDLCEEEKELAFMVNATGPENLAKWCAKIGARLIHVSTDYVFDGSASSPYSEDHPTAPINVYGESKLSGEKAIIAQTEDFIIVRTSWLFGRGGPNFITTMLSLARERDQLQVVNDQKGRPTYTKDLAYGIRHLIEKDAKGIFHFANQGECTWFDLCKFSLEQSGIDHVELEPVTSDKFKRPARRPAYSVLALDKFEKVTSLKPRHWKEAVEDFLQEIGACKPNNLRG